jgi:sugar/nucleoside kinase (ribokinase family)
MAVPTAGPADAVGPPELLVVGHVTLDQAGGQLRPGGAAYYAAWTGHRLGLRVALFTAHGPDFPVGALPAATERRIVPAPATTRFELGDGRTGRRLRLLAKAPPLAPETLPVPWWQAPLVLLCPVAGELDPSWAGGFADAALGLAAQGWLRAAGRDGRVRPRAWTEAGLLLPRAQLVVVSEEDVAAFPDAPARWFQRVPLGAVTRGAAGATLYVGGEPYHVVPDEAREQDATGAGDVFTATLLVQFQRGGDPWEAAAAAACAAAASVEGPGAEAIPDEAGLAARLAAYRRRRGG